MKYLHYVLLALMSFNSFADSFKIETNPISVVKGEQFELIFKVETKSTTAPEITFNPLSLQILGREGTMTSTRTTYINNKLTVKREFVTTYTAIAESPGRAYLRDIEINTGDQTLRKRSFPINVRNYKAAPQNVHLVAIADKTTVFKNESIFVQYYLLYKGSLRSYENRKFPKLKKFTKRSYQNKRVEDRVEYEGQIYKRQPVFTVQLYPEEVGKASIDSMTIHVQYRKSRRDQFIGGFGFGVGRMASKTLTSKPVEITVKPFPAGAPSGFTGLVGKLDYKLNINKTKFLVNEPVEVTLTGSGDVAFEIFDAPSIYTGMSMEEFEKNSDLKLSNNENATETTNYTYLPRTPGTIPAKDFNIVYLDPKSESYKTITLPLPQLTVGGGAIGNNPKVENTDISSAKVERKEQLIASRSIIAPIFNYTDSLGHPILWINRILLLLFALSVFFNFKEVDFMSWMYKTKYDREVREIKKQGIDYKGIHSILFDLDPSQASSLDKLDKSKLGPETKKYFKDIITSLEVGDYFENKRVKIPYNSKYFKELRKYLNETHKES